MVIPVLNYPVYQAESPVGYYSGVRKRPRYAPYILGAAAQLPQIYAIKKQEEQAEKEFGLKQETLKKQTEWEKERQRILKETSAAEIASTTGLATKRAELDMLLAKKAAQQTREATKAAEKTAEKAQTLGYVKTGIQGLSIASQMYQSGLFSSIVKAIGSVGGWFT